MPVAPTTATSAVAASGRSRAVGFAVGVALLGVGVWVLVRDERALARFRALLPTLSWRIIAFAVLLPAASWVLSSLTQWTLTRPRARVGLRETFALVGVSWLLNFLPFSPGLVARVAYLRRAHGLPVLVSARIVLESIVLGWAAALLAAGPLVLVARGLPGWSAAFAGFLALGVVCLALSAPGLRRAYARALLLKWLDLGAWTVRYAVLFGACGLPLSIGQAVVIAVAAQSAMLTPFIGNGLGVREWIVGLLASSLPAWWAAGGGGWGGVHEGLTVDVLNRAGEVVAAVPIGLGSAWFVRGLLARHGTGPGGGAWPAREDR